MTNEAREKLILALDICTHTSSKQWPNAEVVGHYIAEALGLSDHDLTADEARAELAHYD